MIKFEKKTMVLNGIFIIYSKMNVGYFLCI